MVSGHGITMYQLIQVVRQGFGGWFGYHGRWFCNFDVSTHSQTGGSLTMVGGSVILMYRQFVRLVSPWMVGGRHPGGWVWITDVSTTVIWCYDRGGIIFTIRSIVLDQNSFTIDAILQMSYCPWVCWTRSYRWLSKPKSWFSKRSELTACWFMFGTWPNTCRPTRLLVCRGTRNGTRYPHGTSP